MDFRNHTEGSLAHLVRELDFKIESLERKNNDREAAIQKMVDTLQWCHDQCGYASPWQIRLSEALEAYKKSIE